MSFTFTKTTEWVDRGKRHAIGTFTNGAGDSGGDIYTGLQTIDRIELQHTGSSVVAGEPAVNEDFPCHDPVTIVTTTGADGMWHAVGS